MIEVDKLTDPVVRAFVAAVNANDRDAFFALRTPDATLDYGEMRTAWKFVIDDDKVTRFETGQAR